jgi:hypothetical protein
MRLSVGMSALAGNGWTCVSLSSGYVKFTILFHPKFQITRYTHILARMERGFLFEDVDFILKRDWFVDTESIVDLLWELSEEVYWQVVEHRHEYALRIRELLESNTIPRPLKVRDFSEVQFNAEQDAILADRETWMRAHRKAYVPPPRPREDADDEMDAVALKLTARVSNKRKRILENELAFKKSVVDSIDRAWTDLTWLDALHRDVGKRFIPSASNAAAK